MQRARERAPSGEPLLRSAPASHADARDRQRRRRRRAPRSRRPASRHRRTRRQLAADTEPASCEPSSSSSDPPRAGVARRGGRDRPTRRWWRSSVRGRRRRWSAVLVASCGPTAVPDRRSRRRCRRPTAGSSSAAGSSWSAVGLGRVQPRLGPLAEGPTLDAARRWDPTSGSRGAVGPMTHRGVRASRPSRRWPAAPRGTGPTAGSPSMRQSKPGELGRAAEGEAGLASARRTRSAPAAGRTARARRHRTPTHRRRR